jgi:hypothetical protein
MLGVREKSAVPEADFHLRWVAVEKPVEISGAIFHERFLVLDPSAKPLADFPNGEPAAFEHKYGNGSAMIIGTFAGLANETPEALSRQRANIIVGNMPSEPGKAAGLHPLGAILTEWAGIPVPDLKTTAPIDLQQLVGDKGRMIFLINWESRPAKVELNLQLDRAARQIREITTGQALSASGARVRIAAEVPAEAVRVYRIDY